MVDRRRRNKHTMLVGEFQGGVAACSLLLLRDACACVPCVRMAASLLRQVTQRTPQAPQYEHLIPFPVLPP